MNTKTGARLGLRQKLSGSLGLGVLLGLLPLGHALAQTTGADCERAWSDYNEFKRRTTMEASQYPLTSQGTAVRAACGPDALPVPPGSDAPHRPVHRKKTPPAHTDKVKPAVTGKAAVTPASHPSAGKPASKTTTQATGSTSGKGVHTSDRN